MKQTLTWLLGIGCVGAALVFVLVGRMGRAVTVSVEQARQQTIGPSAKLETDQVVSQSEVSDLSAKIARLSDEVVRLSAVEKASQKEEAIEKAIGQTKAQATAEKILYTFAGEVEVREFLTLWQQRQGMLTRMSVLEWYWNREQAIRAKLVDKLIDDYRVDPMKDYALDRQQRLLIERQSSPSSQPSAGWP